MRRLVVYLLIFVSALLMACECLAEIISSDRLVAWEGNVGISNGIPDSATKTIYTTLSAGASLTSLQNAIDACPEDQVIQLSSGSYSFSSRIDIQGVNSGIVLRGATNANGTPATTITFSDASSACVLMRSSSGYQGLSTDANLSEDAVKGGTTLTLSSVPAWVTVGDLIGIDQLDESAFVSATGTEGGTSYREDEGQGARGMGQINRVIAKTGTTITVEVPLYYGWKTAQTAQIFAPGYDPSSADPLRGFGFENIIFAASFSDGDCHVFKMENCDQCYWLNCKLDDMPGGCGWWSFMSFRCHVKKCYITDSPLLGGGQGYGTAWYHLTSACLVEDSIFELLHNAMTANYGAAGNVWAYNYELSGQSDSGQNPGMNTHGVHCFMNLWEGNYCEDKLLADWTHGSSSHCTVFRNRVTGENGTSDSRCCISVEYYNRYWNVVGNVLGTDGLQNKARQHSGSTAEGTQGSILKLGGEANINDDFNPADAYSYTSGMYILDHGNFDYVNDDQVWESGVADQDIPDSLYVTAKPDYFGALSWPPFDPASPATSTVTNIPAGYRYVTGEDPPAEEPAGSPVRTMNVGTLHIGP